MAVTVKEENEEQGKGKANDQEKIVSSTIEQQMLEMKKQMDEMSKQLKEKNENPSSEAGSQEKFYAEMMKKMSAIGNGANATVSNIRQFTNFDEISSEDMLDEKDYVTFMCNRVGHIIVDAIIDNQNVNVPYAPIIFDFKRADRIRSGKETNIYNTSEYVCKSKKELDFLRRHHLLGVSFYEKSGDKTSVIENKVAVKMVGIMSGLKGVSSVNLFKMCESIGITPSDNVAKMRQEIAMFQANKIIEAEVDKTESILKDHILNKQVKDNF